MKSGISLLVTSTLSTVPTVVRAHGYMKTPRSRNFVAYQDKHYDWEPSEELPMPEDCPHCLNFGGTLAQCGLNRGIDPITSLPWERNYDFPKNALDGPMRPSVQATYTEGQEIELEVLVTTHHKGHFEFKACPIVPLFEDDSDRLEDLPLPLEAPTADCFDRYKLTFLEDVMYGAPPDENHPERAYIAPAAIAEHSNGLPEVQPVRGATYKMRVALPEGLTGEVVLLQWYWLTANSCKHEGYDSYPFPESWGSDVALYPGLPDCEGIPPDGNGVPEQFWNCAEIKIEKGNKSGNQSSKPKPKPEPEPELEPEPEPEPVIEVFTVDTETISGQATERKLCSDANFNYYEATLDCTGYVYCTAGVPGDEYPCGNGMLYDQLKQSCNWADEVSCGTQPQLDGDSEGVVALETGPVDNPLLEWSGETIRDHDKTIIGYYASWQWYDRDGLAAPINMDFNKITRANFAFFQITTDGDIYGTDSWADPITMFGPYDWMAEGPGVPKYCSWDAPAEPPVCSAHHYEEGLIYLAHQAGAEVYPSLGGWSLSDPFPAMAANPKARENFARQCVELIKNYNFDGIDIDWEYPGYAPHSGTPDDTVNFNLLLDEVRKNLDELEKETGRYYGLTAALPCGPSIIDYQDIAHVSSVLTELNLMTYDFHGSWNDKTGVNAPLYDQIDSPEFSVHGCVENWKEGGASPEKINIGLPFYGRSFAEADKLYGDHSGPDMSTFFEDEGSPQYYNIVKNLGEMTSVRDDQTFTQYAYGKTGLVSYDDERAICDKTEYAIENDLNGYIIWELSGDLMPDLSTPLLDATNAKLLDPKLDCANGLSSVLGMSSGNDPKEEPMYYPDYSAQSCLADGNHPAHLQAKDRFHTADECCDQHFGWVKEECLSASTPAGEVATTTTTSTSTIPTTPSSTTSSTTSSTVSSAASSVTSTSSTTSSTTSSSTSSSTTTTSTTSSTTSSTSSSTTSTTSSTTKSTTSTQNTVTITSLVPTNNNNDIVANQLQVNSEDMFYPVFQSNGGATHCVQGGQLPDWAAPTIMKESLVECCEEYAFEWHVGECLGFISLSNGDAASLMSESVKYAPDFHMLQCVKMSGDQLENWMTEKYLRESLDRCCEDFFSKAVTFSSCALSA